jgi:hypothetical protein
MIFALQYIAQEDSWYRFEKANKQRNVKGRLNHTKSGRGEVAWLAYRPVEPGARVQIPAPALKTRGLSGVFLRFSPQLSYTSIKAGIFQ